MKTTTIAIDGMTCDGCVQSVRRVLARVDGVTGAEVTMGSATVTFDERRADEAKLRGAIGKAGYTPR
jgi:copper chaperone